MGGTNPGNQSVTLSNTGTAPLNFTASATSTPAGWLTVSPSSGRVAAGGSTSLTVSANTASLTTGSFTGTVSVSDPAASNSPRSFSVSLAVNNPAPTVSSIAPSSATAGSADFTLTVNGSGFISSSQVQWNGSNRTTTFVSSTELTAAIPASDLAVAGTANVTVVTPPPGGGTSPIVVFNITGPRITSLNPTSAVAGGAAFTLSVTGTGFVSNSVVRWNGGDRTTTFVSDTQLTAAIPASDIATPGTAQVTVFTPGAEGGTSNAVRFGIPELIPGVGVIERVSVASDGAQGNGFSAGASMSADGGFVAFHSNASNLVAADTNVFDDVFVRDRQTGQTTRVSVASDGTEGNSGSFSPSLSADGRFVAFVSPASNLVAGDTNAASDIFVLDRQAGQTTRVSVVSDGTQGNGLSFFSSISADGRFVAFESDASNLVASDTNAVSDIFVHDRQSGQTTRVSVASDGTQGNSDSFSPSISADGRIVAFASAASNLVPGDTNGRGDIFVHDRQTGQTTRVSVASDGTQANTASRIASRSPSISADGRFVAFDSGSSNLVPGDTNSCGIIGNCPDVFVRDTCVGAPGGCVPSTSRVSVASDGSQGNGFSAGGSISADGRFVAFGSSVSNLVPGDTNGRGDIFLRDTCVGAPAGCAPSTVRVSVASDGTQADDGSFSPSISADGAFVAFGSSASNLMAGDSNGFEDIFVSTTGQVSAPVIVTTGLPDGKLGLAYSATLTVPGGMAPLTWSIDEGGAALPPGVTLDPSSGVLSGLPMLKGTFAFTVRITDSASPAQSATRRFILTIR